jgi:hypothetical protein
MMKGQTKPIIGSLLALSVLGAVVFFLGLNGPFIFDDQANILSNLYVTIHKLDLSSLYLSALSGSAGPLGRPIPMMSFAINYYFSGGFDHTFGFKLTNLIIHIVNGFLVYFVFKFLLTIQQRKGTSTPGNLDEKQTGHIALVLAAIWLVHPLQVNTVLYVVQRMTSLSALFVLLGLIVYLVARTNDDIKRSTRVLLLVTIPMFLILGLLSKENAILLLPFIFLIEVFYFRDNEPWLFIKRWNPWSTIVFTLLCIIAVTVLVFYSLPGYHARDFSLAQRLMTEARVLVFYLSLIFIPLLYKFGLFHDDITISTSLLDPLTTLYSLLLLLSITLVAIIYRKKYPYLLFGWIWFFVAHSIESTVVPLELAHEHRNYVALIGPLFASAGLISRAYRHLSRPVYLLIVSMIIGSIALVTFVRSEDWSSYQNLIVTESTYHPASPRAQAALGSFLVDKHILPQGLEAMTRAHELQPNESGFLLNMLIIKHMMGNKTPQDWRDSLVISYGKKHISPLGMQVLDYAYDCTFRACRGISKFIQTLASSCSNNSLTSRSSRARCMYYDGLLARGRGDQRYAVRRFRDSARLDKDFLRPTMEMALVQLENSNYTEARATIEKLIQRNERTRFKKNQRINNLISFYNKTIRSSGLSPLNPVAD